MKCSKAMCSDFNWQRDNAIVQKSIPRDKCEAMRRITMWFVLLNAMAQKTSALGVSMAEERSRRRKIETWVMWCETISTSNVIRQSSKMDRETTVKLLEWWMETQSDTFGLMLWFQKTSASVCRWPKREEEGESEKCRKRERFDVGGAAR